MGISLETRGRRRELVARGRLIASGRIALDLYVEERGGGLDAEAAPSSKHSARRGEAASPAALLLRQRGKV